MTKASGMSNSGGSREYPRAGEAVAGTQWHDRYAAQSRQACREQAR